MRLVSLTYDELVAHGVSQAFAQVLADPDGYHPDLDVVVGKTHWDYFIPEGVSEVVPLWDCNADSLVRWKRDGQVEYVWLFHDDPKWIHVARSEQGIMAKLWQEWVEFQDATDEECRLFAEAIGFRHWKEGLSVLETRSTDAIEQWRLGLT